MKFRYMEKVKVKNGFYRNYSGVVMAHQRVIDNSTKIPTSHIVYTVDLVISKDPPEKKTENFREEELKMRWF